MGDERILVVDDEPSVVRFCTRLLTDKGYQVHGANGGQEALAQLEQEQFDLLLVDLMMTDVDGLTVLRRAQDLDPQATAIVITGYGTIENAIEALRAGARDLVLKPFAPEDLLSAVTQVLAEKRQDREALHLRTRLPVLEISQALMTEGNTRDLAQRLVEAVVQRVPADGATLSLLDEKNDELNLVGGVGLAEPPGPTPIPVGQGITRQALQQGEPLAVDEETSLDLPSQALGIDAGASLVCVPLRARKGTVGVLTLGRSDGPPFTPSERNLLSIVGNQIAIALDNAQLYEIVARGKREWEATFDAMDDWVCLVDLQDRILRTNRVGEKFTEVPLKDMIGQSCCTLVHGSAEPLLECPLQRMRRSHHRESLEFHDPDRDRWLSITADPVLDKDGTLVGAVHTARDVTAAKWAEEAVRESEEKFRSVIEQSSDGIALIDRRGIVVEWNQGQERIFGLPRSQVLGLPVWEVHEQLQSSVLGLLNAGQEPQKDQLLEREIQRPDGQRRIVLTAVFPIQTTQGRMVGSVSRDITERKAAEEALRREKEFTELLINSSMDGILAFDRECRYTVWNPGMERISGVSRADVLGQNAFQVFPFLKEIGEDRFFLDALAGETVTAENRPYTIPGTGRKGFFEGHYAPLRGDSGEVIGGLGVIHDITRRIQAEEDLHRLSEELLLEKEKLEDVVHGVGAGLVLLDAQTQIVWANEIMQDWFGPLAQWEGQPACDLYGFADPETECNALRARRSGQMEHGETHIHDVQGQERHFELVAMPLKNKDGEVTQIVELTLDVTERQQAEEELQRRNEELAALNAIAIAASRYTGLEEILDATLKETLTVLDAEGGLIFLSDEAGQSFALSAHRDIPPEIRQEISGFEIGEGLAGQVAQTGQPLLIHDLAQDPRSAVSAAVREGWRAGIITPLRAKQDTVGVMILGGRVQGQFTSEDLELSTSIGHQIGSAVENARLLEAIQQEKNFATSLVETAQAIVLVLDTQGRIVHFNPYMEEISGYRIEEVQGRDWFTTFLPQRDHERIWELFQQAVGDIQTRGNVNPIVTKDGRELEIEWYDKTLKDAAGKVAGVLAIGQDITEHKLAEKALERSREQLRALTSYLQNAREEERTHVAREIHDEFGQALTALKMDLSWLARRLPADAIPLQEKTQAMSDLVDDTIHMVRRVATDLRPGLLDNLGLVAALEWQTREFQDRTGIACELYLPEDDLDRDQELDTVFFRIFQETLTNIARHAGATEVRVDLENQTGDRVLVVRDNGRGITEEQIDDPRSLGLIGMRERVRPWGGQIVVQGVPDQGTTVTVRVPRRDARAHTG